MPWSSEPTMMPAASLALLAMAKQILDEDQSTDRRTIVFAAWGIEEDPFYIRGSQAFIDALDTTVRDRIMYYVNFDMIGAYDHYEIVYAMGTYDAVDGYGASPANTLMTSIADSYPSWTPILVSAAPAPTT